jgi:hypothetical protein
VHKSLILVVAFATTTLAAGCSGAGSSLTPLTASQTIAPSQSTGAAVASSIRAPLTLKPLAASNVAYLPHGGPIAAAAAPGYAQLAEAGLDDHRGSQFSLTSQNVIRDAASSAYGGPLSDDKAAGANTVNSSTVVDFTMGSTSFLNAVARANATFSTAYDCSVGGSQLQLIEQHNNWRSIALTNITSTPGATYALKFDVSGSTLTCKLFNAAGKLTATVTHTDTALTAAGFNGVQFYAPDGVHGATSVNIWYAVQPDSVVGTPVGPTGGATPTPAPTASGTGAALLCQHFASNPMCHAIPASPAVASNSGSWSTLEFGGGRNSVGGLQISNAADPYSDGWDNSEPRYELPVGAATVQQTAACDQASWSNYLCGQTHMNGKVINIPKGVQPQGGGDHHFAYDDFANNGEQDFWDSEMPSANGGTLHVGGAGFCAWGSDGTGCSGSTATSLDTSMGGIDAALLKAAESDSIHGSLAYALSTSEVCNDVSTSFVYPATSSDGDNSNSASACSGHTGAGQRPPEGSRWFLALHDADINATNNAPYVKVLLRTMDEDHFGGTITDTNWSGSSAGLLPQFNRGDYSFAAAEAGISYGTDVLLPITTNGINLSTAVHYCSNGTC